MIKRILIVVIGLIVLGALSLLFVPNRFFAASGATDELLTIAPKTVSFGINSSGVLRATSVQNFGGPAGFGNYWQWQIVSLIQEGKNVKKDDVLINFDTQKINMDLMQFQNELEQANKELEKTRVQIDLEDSDLKSKLAAAQNKYDNFKLKDSSNTNVQASGDIEKDKLGLEQARQEVEALKSQIEWHTKSSEATYKIIASKKARAENKVNEIKSRMANFQAKADRDGVVVYKTKWNGDRFQVGENVWSGQPIIEIPDLNTIIAEASVPEVDIGKLKVGLKAEITMDALPGKTFTGEVKSMGTLVHPKSWDIPNKVLEAQIALDKLDISVMRPAMSVKVKIETASIADVIAVPLKAIHSTAEGGIIKVKTDTGWREQNVKLGDSNGTEIIVTEGLKPGDRIAIDYAKAK
ncbi:MAG TPA: efflux RND transporter periplasmic adaptor subunit [Blastocatellia bacterium]|nr:efflux RND transporter periplasmic adaptor subunit [Blastocatellia bacterium]